LKPILTAKGIPEGETFSALKKSGSIEARKLALTFRNFFGFSALKKSGSIEAGERAVQSDAAK